MDQTHINNAIQQIAAVDKDVALAMQSNTYPSPRIRPAGFETFLNTIISQQLSLKAADTIWGRVCKLMPEVTAENLLSVSDIALREAGLSQRKMEYAQGLAKAIVDGSFVPEALSSMTDQEAIEMITQLRGFGQWSAEIYLMFSLRRQDIFPADDLILLTSLQKLKNLSERPKPKEAREMVAHWSPWRSAGSLFLWHYHHQ